MYRILCFWGLLLLFLIPIPGLNFVNKQSLALETSGQIKGKVIDAETKASIEYATVSLFHFNDSIPIRMTATNSKGDFSLPFDKAKAGDYLIVVRFIGFKEYKTKPFTLTANAQDRRLEPILLKPDSIDLSEVTVRANAGTPVYQPEKKIIYTENQLTGAGGSAADLLLKLPSLTQNPDGKIAIHGNSNLLVYINGKPSSLKGDELLQNTPAEEVKKIELITNPSAKYDASGSGGIINLITTKSTQDGFNGHVQAAIDHLGGYSSDLLLNYKYHKFSFFAGIDHNRRRNRGI